MKNSKRLIYIDLLESIAIFFVLLYHSRLYATDFLSDSSISNYISYFSTTILSTCVPLFFFANGYLLFSKPFVLKKHIFKIIRIIVLTFVWAILLITSYMLISDTPISIKEMILHILNLDTDWNMDIFWYLGALICIYILFPLLKIAFDSNKKVFVFFTVACAILTFGFVLVNEILCFVGVVSHHSISINFPAITMFNPFRGSYGYSFVYFCTGGLMYFYKDKILSISKLKRNLFSIIGIFLSCICLFLVGILYSKSQGKLWDAVWYGYDTIFTFMNTIFIFILCLNYKKDNKFIRTISCNTLGIYFIHSLFIRLTKPYIKTVDLFCNIPMNLLYSFAILCVSLAVILIIRKIPLLKKLV